MFIDSSHQPEARRAFVIVIVLTVLLLLSVSILGLTSSPRIPHFLALHVALEMPPLIVCASIFAVAWSLQHEHLSRNVILLASAFLGVALLDFSQMLSYEGMPEFLTPSSPEKSIYFWLFGRLFAALALVAVAVLSWGTKGSVRAFRLQLALVLIVVAVLHGVYFGYAEWVPPTFIRGQGLAPFKLGSEYVLITLYLLAGALFAWRMRRPRRFNASGLFATACIMAQSEIFFTLYTDVADTYSLVGHLYKLLAYAFLFHAVFVETVSYPYTRLRESQQQLQATIAALPDLVFEMDAQGRYLAFHSSPTGELVVPLDQLLGRKVQDVMPTTASATVMAAFDQARRRGVSQGKIIELLIGDEPHWFELSVACRPASYGQKESFVVISRNITDRIKNEQFLHTLSLAVEQSPIAFVVADTRHRITMANEAYTRITGYSKHELLGRRSFEVLRTRASDVSRLSILQQLSRGKSWQGELAYAGKGERKGVLSALIHPVRNQRGEIANFIAYLEDITQEKKAAQRIHQLSFYDQLTGLPNQAQLQEHFQYVSQKASTITLLWINLDHFKHVNDSLGHQVGDEVLVEMSQRLRQALRPQDFLSRLSGDAFLIVVPDRSDEEIAAFTQTLLEIASRPLQLADQSISLTASIGIGQYPSEADQFETLLMHAEAAMYQVKDNGRNSSCFFVPEIQSRVTRLLTLSNALRQALSKGELHLAYQPQMRLSEQRIFGAEALLRWDSPELGSISPAEFIPLAESTGLIISIGEWVLNTALQQIRCWRDNGLTDLIIAVNLSATEFNLPDLPARVSRALEQFNLPPGCLALELTESVAMTEPEVVVQRMQELQRLGIRLAIDDFGTGYSSLSYLKRFEIHKLKIDQSFVRDVGSNPNDQAIVASIIQMAHSLGVSTIAEGVETAEQLAFLQSHGCDDIQGYYFSKPLNPVAFERFVLSH